MKTNFKNLGRLLPYRFWVRLIENLLQNWGLKRVSVIFRKEEPHPGKEVWLYVDTQLVSGRGKSSRDAGEAQSNGI